MSKISKTILLSFLGLVLVVGLFLLPELLGKSREVKASFGGCAPVYFDNTSKVASDVYQAGNEVTWTGPLIKITPTHSTDNNFNVSYSQDPVLSQSLSCDWQSGFWFWKLTDSDLICPANSFMAGMQWKRSSSGENERKIYCCSDNVSGITASPSTWEVPYGYTAAGVTADCSKDAAGAAKAGGVIVGLKNGGNANANVGVAVCRQFSRNPMDLQVTVSCGDLGVYGTHAYQGYIQCTGNIKNYGCDLITNVSYDRNQGLGVVFYSNVTNAEGKIIGQGVTLDDVLTDSGGWGRLPQCNTNVVSNSVNSGTGQGSGCTFGSLRDEEYFITFCARGKAGSGGGETPGNLSNNCATARVTANKPDLVVESVTCSSDCTKMGEYYFVAPGAPFTLQGVVKNQGRAGSSEITESRRGVTFSIGDSQVPNVSFGLAALNPGATTNKDPNGNPLQYTFNFPTSFSGDKWQDYKVCVDPQGTLGGGGYYDYYGDVLESGGTAYSNDNDASNCKVFKASASLANLVVHTFEGLALVPVGVTQNLKVVVENIGATASGQTTVRVYKNSPAPQEKICEFSLPGLGAAGSANAVSQTFQCPFVFSQKTFYHFKVVIDEDNLVGEISENDNGYNITIKADYPDFTVPELTCYPGTPSSPGIAGAALTNENFFCRAKIKNTGQAPILEDLVEGITFYAVDSPTETQINHCLAILIANEVRPGDPGQQVQCVFSSSAATPALAMQQIKVCVDPNNNISELVDTEENNCKIQTLNFQLPDLKPQGFTCKYSSDGTSWLNCMPGFSGSGIDWRVPDGANLKFASRAKNSSAFDMSSQTLTKGMVYYFDGQEKCNFNLAPLLAGQTSDFIPPSEAEWCLFENMNREKQPGLHYLKACCDPKGSTIFGELFEMDDSDESNCVEKSIAVAAPNLVIASLECKNEQGYNEVFFKKPFVCSAKISNVSDVSLPSGLAEEKRRIVYYLDGQEVGNYPFEVSAAGTVITSTFYPQPFTFSDFNPHTIKVCVDPQGKNPPHGYIYETDESDESNCRKLEGQVVVPDFKARSFNCDDPVQKGKPFTCTAQVRSKKGTPIIETPVEIGFYGEGIETPFCKVSHQFLNQLDHNIICGELMLSPLGSLPADVAVKVRVDPDNKIPELDDTPLDNDLTISVTLVEELLPDFEVVENSISCSPRLALGSASFASGYCEARVANLGPGYSEKDVYVFYYLNGEYRGQDKIGPLRANRSQQTTYPNLLFSKTGTYNTRVCVNPTTLAPAYYIAELLGKGTGENCGDGPSIEVVERFLPDFTIVEGTELGCGAGIKRKGEPFSCSVTAYNNGDVAGTAKVEFYYYDVLPDGAEDVGAKEMACDPSVTLNAKASQITTCVFKEASFPNINTPGTYKLRACVDGLAEDPPDEYDENNNCSSDITVEIQQETPIAITDFTVSATKVYIGGTVSVTTTAEDSQGVKAISLNPDYGKCPYAWCDEWQPQQCGGAASCTKTWQITETTAGEKQYKAYAEGYRVDGTTESVESDVVPVSVSERRVEVTFSVYDAYEPDKAIIGATIIARGGQEELTCTTKEQDGGTCTLSLLENYQYTVSVSAPDYLSIEDKPIEFSPEQPSVRLELEPAPKTTIVSVVDEHGPAPAVKVKVSKAGYTTAYATCLAEHLVGTCILHLPPGEYEAGVIGSIATTFYNCLNCPQAFTAGDNITLRLEEKPLLHDKCVDTDDGIDYFTKGATKDRLSAGVDHCGGDWVGEYYCEGDFLRSKEFLCSYGCEDGACLTVQKPVCGNGALEKGEECDDGNTKNGDGCSSTCQIEAPEAWCVDPDQGEAAQFTQSTTRDSAGVSKQDTCKNDNYVYEYYCTEEDTVSPEPDEIFCEFGCAGGTCWREQQKIPVTIEVVDAADPAIKIPKATVTVNGASRYTDGNGQCSVSLLPDNTYSVKAQHSNYYERQIDITPSAQKNKFTIQLTKIPVYTFSIQLYRGWNLVSSPTEELLTLDDIRKYCTTRLSGFLTYTQVTDWIYVKGLESNDAGFILIEAPCVLTKEGRRPQFTPKRMAAGEHLFSPSSQTTMNQIKGDCSVTEIQAQDVINQDWTPLSNSDTLNPMQGYWIKIANTCTLKKSD